MLCLDMKLVSRLRNLSSSSNSSNCSAGSSSSSSSSGDEQVSRGTTNLVRDRSRSVCTPVLSSSQLRQLQRRASHQLTCSDSRRSVLSRRHYGSVELLPQIEQDGLEGRRFRVENGDSPGEKEEMFGSPSTPVLENPEYQTRWYFKYFLGKVHQNYVAADQDKQPLFLSVVVSEDGDQCRLILWRRSGAQKISLPYSSNRSMSVRQILATYFGLEKLDKAPREILSAEIQKDLLLLEEQEGSVNFKFGVMYAREGQRSDDEMLSNESASPEFEHFLEMLGERIRLKGWDKYRGGLDVKADMTGSESVYTVYAGHEVMYHVSTLLPHCKDDPQQLERKRHIGNDIINIIFSDEPGLLDRFDPAAIKSQFTHVFALVTRDQEEETLGWRLAVYCDESVPLFGPSLPWPAHFSDAAHFREFLLVKLINAEKASFDTPTFSRKRQRTLDSLLRDMYQEHAHDGRSSGMLQRRALSDVVETGARRRLEAGRGAEMLRVGQALKLEAIVQGLAPTSLAGQGRLQARPWEPRCILSHWPGSLLCGDALVDGRLLLACEAALWLLDPGAGPARRLLSLELGAARPRQLDALEAQGVVLLRSAGERRGDCCVRAFRLAELLQGRRRELRLERGRGAQLYCLSRAGARLRLALAAGRRLSVFQWRRGPWRPGDDQQHHQNHEDGGGFELLGELQAGAEPNLITLLDAGPERGWALCCALRHQYELHFADGACRVLAELPRQARLVGALDLGDEDEPELLLCYNNTCHFQKLSDDSTAPSEFDFQWTSVPLAVACAFPYVLGFSADALEIRLIVNGNLVHSLAVPGLRLISAKRDVFFAASSAEQPEALRIYRIPLQTMARAASPETCLLGLGRSASSSPAGGIADSLDN